MPSERTQNAPTSCPRCGGSEALNGFDICDYCSEDLESEARYEEDEDSERGRDISVPVPSDGFKNNPYKRFVGFELEFFHPDNRYQDVSQIVSFGSFHGDGSLRIEDSAFIPAEFSSVPTRGDHLLETINKVTKILKQTKCKVNNTCGFHAHFDMKTGMKDEELKNIREWWIALEHIFFTFVPANRRTGTYCKPVKRDPDSSVFPARVIRRFAAARPYQWSHDRYYSLNICAYRKWGTYEIRMHQGTLNKEKITSWIMFYLGFFEVFSKIPLSTYRKGRIRRMNNRELLIFIFQQIKTPFWIKKELIKRIARYENKAFFVKRQKDFSDEGLAQLSNRDVILRTFS